MFLRAFLPSLFDLYQMLLGSIGLVAVFRVLCGYSWIAAVEYSVVTIAAFWVGQGLVALFQKPQHATFD